jgi:DNA repair protein RadA/Sms
MAEKTTEFVCQSCGAVYRKWQGKCDACNEWNSLIEEETSASSLPKSISGGSKGRKIDFVSLDGISETKPRTKTGISELDRVCGGGLVAGSVMLVGGDPGIGKSTLLLQATGTIAMQKGRRCIYISGEEAIDQVRMRAIKIGFKRS